MYCRQCGAPIPDGNSFCENCGAPVSTVPETGAPAAKAGQAQSLQPDPAPVPGQPDQKKRKQKLVIITVICALIFGGCIGGVTAAVSSSHGDQKYQEKLDEAAAYVSEENYDQALAAYDEAIAIKPKKPEAYIAKAEYQSAQGHSRDALDTLDQAKTMVKGSDEIGQIDSSIKAVRTKYEGEWKTAYRKVLEERESEIREYEDYAGDARESVALCDLDEDGTAELLFFVPGGDSGISFRLCIYTYDGSAAEEIRYEWTPAEQNFQKQSGFRDLMVDGGTSYAIYRETGQPGFTAYSVLVGEEMIGKLNRYTMRDRSLEETDALGYWFNFFEIGEQDGAYPDAVDFSRAEYFRDRKKTTKDDYDRVRNDSVKNMDQVIFCSDPFDSAENDEDKELWGAVKSKDCLSQFYDEVLEEVTVKSAAQTDPAQDSMKTENYRLLTYDIPKDHEKEGSEETWLVYEGSHDQIHVVCTEYAYSGFDEEDDVLDPERYSVDYSDLKRRKVSGYDAIQFRMDSSGRAGAEFAGVAIALHIAVPDYDVAFTFVDNDHELSKTDMNMIEQVIRSIRIDSS